MRGIRRWIHSTNTTIPCYEVNSRKIIGSTFATFHGICVSRTGPWNLIDEKHIRLYNVFMLNMRRAIRETYHGKHPYDHIRQFYQEECTNPPNLWYKTHLSWQYNCWSLRCNWSVACRRCSNYIFILNLTRGFKGLAKGNCKMRWQSLKFSDLVRLILEILRYMLCSISLFCNECIFL